MELYIKDNNIIPKNKIVIKTNGMNIFNPSKQMLLEHGWKEYNITYNPSQEELLNTAKENKIAEVISFDSSDEVNSFYVKEYKMWLDKSTRVGLKLRFETELLENIKMTTLWHDGIPFELTVEDAVKMLHLIEKYASKCYDNTQQHISNIKKLTNVTDVENYDYRSGYPEKLIFNI